ncbi:MAG: ParB/RepB/Spo0J family partition protein [Methylocystis sp.]
MHISEIPIAKIIIKPGRHILKMDSVAMLVKSIEMHEQLTPIIVLGNNNDDTYELIAGRQRMEAMKQLGNTHIAASVEIAGITSDIHASALEFAENLHRSDLDLAERSDMEAKYEALYMALLEEQAREFDEPATDAAEVLISVNNSQKSKTEKNPKGAGRKPGGIAKQARDTGRTRDDIRTYRAIAALPPEVKAKAKELGQSNSRKTLLAAAKEQDPEAQRAVIEAAAKAVNERKVVKAPVPPAPVATLSPLVSLWDNAPDEDRDALEIVRVNPWRRAKAIGDITIASATLASLWNAASEEERGVFVNDVVLPWHCAQAW